MSTRMAVIVGIDHYRNFHRLHGCVGDALEVGRVLGRHEDLTVNFATMVLTCAGPGEIVTRGEVKSAVRDLFGRDHETALFYFAGHGHVEATGGYLLTSECASGDEGLSLNEIMTMANLSPARNRIILLDSCHSGIAGAPTGMDRVVEIAEGTTILTASGATEYATEEDGRGTFTTLLVDALDGAAANLMGDVTAGSIYAHIDQSLGAQKQRPLFKTNISAFNSIRRVKAPISLADLHRLPALFPTPGHYFPLDPTYEPDPIGRMPGVPDPVPANVEKYQVLQRCNRVNLVVPVNAPHMWHAAMECKGCRLTSLGEHYRRLRAKQLI